MEQLTEIANPFASTLPKPHEPTLKPKLCQRACKANALREIALKNLPTLLEKKTLTHEPTKKTENKMILTRKSNNDNGLHDWKKEHQAVTKAICNKGFSGNSSILPRIKFGVGGQAISPQSLTAHSLNRYLQA